VIITKWQKGQYFPQIIFFSKNEVLSAQVLLIGSYTPNIVYGGAAYTTFPETQR
jgi:hypothetical protein